MSRVVRIKLTKYCSQLLRREETLEVYCCRKKLTVVDFAVLFVI